MQLTAVEEGVGDFEWSHDGRFMALSLTEPASENAEKREELYGEFAVEDAEHRMSHLWLLDVEKAKQSQQARTYVELGLLSWPFQPLGLIFQIVRTFHPTLPKK